ncbi:MAG: nucleoside triphosphate pyrophosphohydrolase [Reinekea sp.]
MTDQYTIEDLKYLMSRLRHTEDGCPWDIKQTYRSIVPHTLEEVYEVIDTIEREDFPHLSEELGDLLFQVVFYAQIASEEERFSFDDIIHRLVSKLIYRHPHVFPDGTLQSRRTDSFLTESDVKGQWEVLKAKQKQRADSILADIPVALPGMIRARKLQSKAAKVGFDWPSVQDVLEKADEELAELKEAIAGGDQAHMESELGDILFVLANVARHLDIDPEQAVRNTNQKFEHRFRFIEQQVGASEKNWTDYSLDELDAYWNQAKERERS